MKKAIIVAIFLIIGTAGFLAYDWYAKTTTYEDDQRVTLYSWMDEKGARHYTNTQPPDGARNVEESKGFKYTDQPLVIKLKNRTVEGYKWVKQKLFKKKGGKSE